MRAVSNDDLIFPDFTVEEKLNWFNESEEIAVTSTQIVRTAVKKKLFQSIYWCGLLDKSEKEVSEFFASQFSKKNLTSPEWYVIVAFLWQRYIKTVFI